MLQDNGNFHKPLLEEYQKLQVDHSWFVHRRRLIIWTLRCHSPQLQSFLEVGCGVTENLATITDRFRHAEICGGELSLDVLQMVCCHYGAKFLQTDACAIPFAKAFEVVGVFDVIEHIDDDRRALSEIYKVCRHSGGLILTVPRHPRLWSRVDDVAKHKHRYTHWDFIERLCTTGLRPLYVNSFMSLLLPVMVPSRLHQKIARAEQEVDEGSRTGKMLNRLFSTAYNIESCLLAHGTRFPAGGSLLAVAVKE